MTLSSQDFRRRIQQLLELDGTMLTEGELSRLTERYAACRGAEPWDIRTYARPASVGAREYRVVRGTHILEVFATEVLANATAVRTALNEMESEGAGSTNVSTTQR